MKINSQKRIHKDTSFQERIDDLSKKEILSQNDIQTILHEIILQYFTEITSLQELIKIVQTIQKHPKAIITNTLQEAVTELTFLSEYLSDEEENSEEIYKVLTNILRKVTN